MVVLPAVKVVVVVLTDIGFVVRLDSKMLDADETCILKYSLWSKYEKLHSNLNLKILFQVCFSSPAKKAPSKTETESS